MIKNTESIKISCDVCKEDFESKNRVVIFETKYDIDISQEGWYDVTPNHYCPNCYTIKENGELVIIENPIKNPDNFNEVLYEVNETTQQTKQRLNAQMSKIMEENNLDWQSIHLWIQLKGYVILTQEEYDEFEDEEKEQKKTPESDLLETKQNAFLESAKPLMKYLCENHHPHVSVIIDGTSAELSEGLMTIKCDDYIVD
jgi:hypothetical protein